MSKKSEQRFKVQGQQIYGPKNFYYHTDEDPILLASLFEIAFTMGENSAYKEVAAMRKKE